MTELARKSSENPGPEHLEAFACLAQNGGNLAATERMTGIPDSTLYDWKQRWPDVYAGIQRRISERIEIRAVAEVSELRLNALEAASESVDVYRERLRSEPEKVKDPAGAAMRMATVGAIAQDKQYLAEGKPQSITGHLSPEDTVKALRRKLTDYQVLPLQSHTEDDGS